MASSTDFNFEVEYCPGNKMKHVDALSRIPVENEVCTVDLTEADWVLAAQTQDDKIRLINSILDAKRHNRYTKDYFRSYLLKQGIVYKKLANDKEVWMVPKACRWQICRLCHDDSGHFGLEKTMKRISENYLFPKMRNFVKKYVRACLSCNYYKHPSGKREGELYPIEKCPIPFHTIHADHVGPFETSKKGNKYLLVLVDGFTKFVFIQPVKDTKAARVTKMVMEVMCLFGAPTRIITDRGTAFTSQKFKVFCNTYGIKHILNAVATPRSNGQCERVNRTILNTLATTAAGSPENEWDTFVNRIQSVINCTENKTTGASPLEVLAGYKGKNIAESTLLSAVEKHLERYDLKEIRERVSERIQKDQRIQKARFDRGCAKAKRYQEGDVVMMLKTAFPATGRSKKLLPKFKGPFRVTQ